MGRLRLARDGSTYEKDGVPEKVRASCSMFLDSERGSWICLVHQSELGSWNAVETHFEEPGEHLLAWHCRDHGPEVP